MLNTIYGRCILLLFFLVCAFLDLRTKTIDLRILAAMGAAEIIWFFLSLSRPDSSAALLLESSAAGLIPGFLLLAAAFLSRGSIGCGDGLFFLLFGFASGFPAAASVLLGSLLIAAIASLFILTIGFVTGHPSGGKSIPFLPFTLPPFLLLLSSYSSAGGLL